MLAFQGRKPKVERGLEDFVQIINVGGNHWVSITNIGCKENAIKVYDSLFLELCEKEQEKFYLSLAALLNTTHPDMIVEYPAMQKQQGTADCGLFAIAVAFSLLSGNDPSQQHYDQEIMRTHLALCFQMGDVATFPVKKSVAKMQKKKKETVDLFCHCRLPYNGEFMIECSTCAQWFHRSCENIPRKVTTKTAKITAKIANSSKTIQKYHTSVLCITL